MVGGWVESGGGGGGWVRGGEVERESGAGGGWTVEVWRKSGGER